MKLTLFILISLFAGLTVKSQVNVSKYLWEYPLQHNLSVNTELRDKLRREMQAVIDSGSLFFRPVTCRYSDQVYESYFLYQEPGRILQTVAMAWPYLTGGQQSLLHEMVPLLFASTIHAPWAHNPVNRDTGIRREFYAADKIWGLNSGFGNYRPCIQNVYSVWLYLYRTGDTTAVEPWYNSIKTFYNTRTGEGIDPGNLYGSMSAHIGMARLARIFNDPGQVDAATLRLTAFLNNGLDIHYADSMAFYGKQGWNAPYANEYDPRSDYLGYRGYIFLNLSPELGRYLRDMVYTAVVQRHNEGLSRFPLWWLRQSPYFTRWTGDEGIGIPSEMFGMIMPVERWVIQKKSAALNAFMQSAPIGIADCYWLEALVLAMESDATDEWVDTRLFPFSTDISATLPGFKNLASSVMSGTDTCFGSLQTIVAGGNGQSFIVYPAGNAIMEAGEKVVLKDGTSVHPNGHLLARINTSGNYCPALRNGQDSVFKPENLTSGAEKGSMAYPTFSVFPNPSGGKFTLTLHSPEEVTGLHVSIFTLTGGKVVDKYFPGSTDTMLDLTGRPAGVYLLSVVITRRRGISTVITSGESKLVLIPSGR
ncbi:MAG: T9SS type A sorting domain-containing protein [Bacteroidetes bacterium]|nr:T9SS type A sorting domain-containing protein [Bacteroidota bacterium]